jgi:hypothetical protein
LAKLAGYHSPTSRECTEVEYASPEWEWAMVDEPSTQSTRKRAHEQLEAEIDALGSDESEGEINDLPFKYVGQVTPNLRGFLTNGNFRFNKPWTVSKRPSRVTVFHKYRMLACDT